MNDTGADLREQDFTAAADDLARLRDALGQAIVGQTDLIEGLITAILANGHVLLEGLPGLGKTHLVKALAGGLGLGLDRVQCTPDLMPADITGSEILVQDQAGRQDLHFRPGPLFTNLLLVDEINRATPKTQAALLEAMQEGQVTQGGRRHPLPQPFWMVATQNPIEIEGTYPLPEAQLDRFLVKLQVEFPNAQGLLDMLEVALDDEPSEHMAPVLDAAHTQRLMTLARAVVIAPPLKRAAVDLVLATHPRPRSRAGSHQVSHEKSGRIARIAEHFRYGTSPRGLQALLRAGRVRALMAGRAHLTLDDLAAVALPCLRHRVLLTIEAELGGEHPDPLLVTLVEQWREGL